MPRHTEAGLRQAERLRPARRAKSRRAKPVGVGPHGHQEMQTESLKPKPHAARSSKITERVRAERSTEKPSKKVDATAAMASMQPVVDQLRALEHARKDGVVALPDGSRLGVTNLAKLFWPKLKLTKGDLLRYYATVAPLILPVVADRPLVMKRFPNGVDDRVRSISSADRRNSRRPACASRPCPTTSTRSSNRAPNASSADRSSRCST